MTGWTKAEIEAELARRAADERRRDEQHLQAVRRADTSRANAICAHCGNPFVSYEVAEFPLCDYCLFHD